MAGLLSGEISSVASLERLLGKHSWVESLQHPSLSSAVREIQVLRNSEPRGFPVAELLRQHSGRGPAAFKARLQALFSSLHLELRSTLESLPLGLALALGDAAVRCGCEASLLRRRWEPSGRPEPRAVAQLLGLGAKEADDDSHQDDGMSALDRAESAVLAVRWPSDLRTAEVRRLLDSSSRLRLRLPPIPAGLPEAELKEAVEAAVSAFFWRLFALPYGRGLATLGRRAARLGAELSLPDLNVKELKTEGGTGTTTTLWAPANLRPSPTAAVQEGVALPAGARDWAEFHNGAAAGLEYERCGRRPGREMEEEWLVSSVWALLERETEPRVAGLLLGLGLGGYLDRLNAVHVHELVTRMDPMLSSAVLLSMAAAKRGSMDLKLFKTLAANTLFLLPPTLLEFQIDSQVQTSAVLGLGLLFMESGNRALGEALLWEMGKSPTAENDPWLDRQAYALTAGLSLGLIHLGQGESLIRSKVTHTAGTVVDLLELYMKGGQKDRWRLCRSGGRSRAAGLLNNVGSSSSGGANQSFVVSPDEAEAGDWLDSYGSGWRDPKPSNYYQEGEMVNVDVTGAGATLGLGLLFLGTGSESVSRLLACPTTLSRLDDVRPDLLLLRTVSRTLVEWDSVLPSREWVESRVSGVVAAEVVRATGGERDEGAFEVDEESVAQAYCNVVAGACFGLGLRFAGSANEEAFKTLLHYLRLFMPKNPGGEGADGRGERWRQLCTLAGAPTIKACLRPVLLAIGMVMAGSGDLDALRVVRMLGGRAESHAHHIATHMTLGLLFLGGARCSLRTDRRSTAALVVSLCPTFATELGDNRQYPQMFRHLVALAAEPRLLVPKEAESGTLVPAKIAFTYKANAYHGEVRSEQMGPVLLPELRLLSSVEVQDERYWPRRFEADERSQWAELGEILAGSGELVLERRSGFLNRLEDAFGAKSNSSVVRLGMEQQLIMPFPDKETFTFPSNFCSFDSGIVDWCERREASALAPSLTHLAGICSKPGKNLSGGDLWSLQCVFAFADAFDGIMPETRDKAALHPEILANLRLNLRNKLIRECRSSGGVSELLNELELSGSDDWGQRLLDFFHLNPHTVPGEMRLDALETGEMAVESFAALTSLQSLAQL